MTIREGTPIERTRKDKDNTDHRLRKDRQRQTKKGTVSKPRQKRAIYIWWNTQEEVQNTGAKLVKWKKGEERTEGSGEQWMQAWEETACWDSGREGVQQNCLFWEPDWFSSSYYCGWIFLLWFLLSIHLLRVAASTITSGGTCLACFNLVGRYDLLQPG